MDLSEKAKKQIEYLRTDYGAEIEKSAISDAMATIMYYYTNHAEKNEQQTLIQVIDTLSNYVDLINTLTESINPKNRTL